jgi:cell division GTPase FtsZ
MILLKYNKLFNNMVKIKIFTVNGYRLTNTMTTINYGGSRGVITEIMLKLYSKENENNLQNKNTLFNSIKTFFTSNIDSNKNIPVSFFNIILKKMPRLNKDAYINNFSGKKENAMKNIVMEQGVKIKEYLKDCDILFILGNLYSDASCIQVSEISQMAKKQNIPTIFIGTTPFSWEEKGIILSEKRIEYVNKYFDGMLILDSDKINSQIKIKSIDISEITDKFLIDSILSIIKLIGSSEVININLTDLNNILKDSGKIFFNSTIGEKNNSDIVVKNLINNTCTKFNNVVKFKKVFFVIYKKNNVTDGDINSIKTKLQEYYKQNCQIVSGVVEDEKIKQDILITLIGVC